MLLKVSMTVSQCKIIAINAQSHSVDANPPPPPTPPSLGGGDHLSPHGRKLIGSLVPVHSRTNQRKMARPRF